jgi:hypothetical protein
MKSVVFNGSPRGDNSNTKILLEQFLKGFQAAGHTCETYFLKNTKEYPEYAELFFKADAVFLAFPLYTDAMPGIVKAFIDQLSCRKFQSGDETVPLKPIIFLVHSGFPEAKHSAPVATYLMKLAKRLNYECPGVMIKGGSEGIQQLPEKAVEKLFGQLYQLGLNYGQTGKLDSHLLKQLRGIEKIPSIMLPVLWVFKLLGLFDREWNRELKKNGAFEKRLDKPYME